MFWKSSLLITVTLSLYATPPILLPLGDSVVPNDVSYYKHKLSTKDIELIYSQENLPFAKKSASLEASLNSEYEKIYDWKFDEKLYVGIISSHNQIANGFSTQWPNNRQINYIGGAQEIDYFTTTSWLETLLYHETAHNYQINVKANPLSQNLHTLFGNGIVLLPLPLILPNVAINPFLLEGNAVLNESWHNNGGRLYSGRLQAETILQAQAGALKPEYLYNRKLAFPYGEIPYIQGGFYALYMAQKYGLERVNRFFKINSEYIWWPFFTNEVMQRSVGVDFEKSIAAFEESQKVLAKKFQVLEMEKMFHSQFFYPFSKSNERIYFLINESGRERPEALSLHTKSRKVLREKGSFSGGKLFFVDTQLYTQSSAKVSATQILQGLYDRNKFLKEGSGGRVVQTYLSDGTMLYFDVASSFDEAQLFVGQEFYAKVNSSVVVDKDDNIYYFKQNKKRRTLYKNREALFSYEGFYGIVSDIDAEGAIYFIANSELGSTLYCYKDAKVTRVSMADNIVAAKLLSAKELFVGAIGESEYYYGTIKIEHRDATPYVKKLFFEEKAYYGKKVLQEEPNIDLSEPYNALFDMHYSGTNVAFAYDEYIGVMGSLNALFADPLSQNSANIFLAKESSDVTIAGVGYSSREYLLALDTTLYGVVDKGLKESVREYGIAIGLTLPLYEKGYYFSNIALHYFQDYDTLKREPLSLSASFGRSEQFGVSFYKNYEQKALVYGVSERRDTLYGAAYSLTHDIVWEIYAGMKAKYSQSSSNTFKEQRGVKLSTYLYQEDMDPSVIDMPSFEGDAYVKEAYYGELNLAKVFNISAYYFTFPLSLQREALYVKYRHYNIQDFQRNSHKVDEVYYGLTLSSVVLNSFTLPVSLEYITNNADFIEEKGKFRLSLALSF